MKVRPVVVTSFLVLMTSCKTVSPSEVEARIRARSLFEKSIEHKEEIVFYGWKGREFKDGAHFRLIFRQGQRAEINLLGYNFASALGSYVLTDDGEIQIIFDRFDVPKDNFEGYTSEWPLLRLSGEDDELLISRNDGKTDWHIDWPLYSSLMENVWPARTINLQSE